MNDNENHDPQKLFKEYLQPEQDKMKTSSVITLEQTVSQLQIASPPPLPNTLPALPKFQKPHMKPQEWTVQQVADWIGSVGLGSVAINFIGTIII